MARELKNELLGDVGRQRSIDGANSRRRHVLATENQLAQLEADPGVVESGRDHS